MDFNKFTSKSRQALEQAQRKALEKGHQQLDVLHLFAALLEDKEGLANQILEQMGLPIQIISQRVSEEIERLPSIQGITAFGQTFITQEFGSLIKRAQDEARELGDEFVSVEHLLLAITEVPSKAHQILHEIYHKLAGTTNAKEKPLEPTREAVLKVLKEVRGSSRVTDADPESAYRALEQYSRNLTELARKEELDPVIGREEEIRRVMQVLSRRKKNNPVLIGEAGVGKTAIVEGVAQRIASSDVPESLKDKEVVALDLGSLVAGTRFRGEFEKRLKAVLREIVDSKGKYILFIDEMHTLVGAGAAEGAIDASNMLKPALARGELHAIGATTLREYKLYIEKDPALERRFQPIYVREPSIDDTIAILRGLKAKYEAHHGLRITDPALVAAAKLSARYISDRFLPDKAVDLIDEAASAIRLEIDSMPDELDTLQRKITKLEIEKEALSKEKDELSRERLKKLKRELAEAKEKRDEMLVKWRKEKDILTKIGEYKKRLESLRAQAEIAEREADLQKVAELKYSAIPNTEKELKKLEEKFASIQGEHTFLKREVTAEDIARVVARWTNIPVEKMLASEQEKLANMEEWIGRRLVNQKRAISAVANAIRRSRTGVAPENRPIGTFIFVGPTGVGKTELAKALAEFMFNDENAIVRVDMSEYMERHAVARLIGSPPGYVGHEEGGQLTEKVRRRPYSLVLFDEIEKAHPEAFNLFLQILDEGRLTDAKGRTVDFTNTIIIMTSNIGNEVIRDFVPLGFETEAASSSNGVRLSKNKAQIRIMREKVMEALRKHFRPEFLNRIDEIIVFEYLTPKELEKIVDLELVKASRQLSDQQISIKLTAAAKQLLAKEGYNPEYGARPLKRLIQKKILDQIAMLLVKNELERNSSALIDVLNDEIVVMSSISKKAAAKSKSSTVRT